MPKANGKHYPYTRIFNGETFRSSGRTFNKTGAKKRAANLRRSPGTKARAVRLGSTARYAVYAKKRGGY